MLYEEIKETYAKRTGSKRMATWEYLGAAAASKLVASATFYPFQLVRARLQDQHQQYSSVIEVAKTTWEREGLRGFYKGWFAFIFVLSRQSTDLDTRSHYISYEALTSLHFIRRSARVLYARLAKHMHCIPHL